MRCILILLLCLLGGCNTIELNKIRVDNSYEDISEIVKRSFTPEAREAIRDIKVYEGLHINSYVVGVNFWSDFISFITFNGIGRKIISSQGTLTTGDLFSTIIHEYVHQLDDMDRDGEIEIIDHVAFEEAFEKMNKDLESETASIVDKSNRFITDLFGIGPLSEEIAYTASWIVNNPNICPLYMHRVFFNILAISRSRVNQLPPS